VRIKELRERLKACAAAVRQQADAMNAEGYTPTAEDQEKWTRVNADYSATRAAVDREESALQAEQATAIRGDERIGRDDYNGRQAADRGSEGGEVAATEEQRAMALQAWCRWQMGLDLTETQEQACRATRLSPQRRQLALSLYGTTDHSNLRRRFRSVHPSRAIDAVADFRATLSSQSGPAGAYLIPPTTLINQLEVNMLAFGGVRQVAEQITTTSGERMQWPTADDTSNTGQQLGESTSVGSSVDPSFGAVFWDAYKFSSKAILVPYELLEDSAFDLASLLGSMLGERLGRITNTKFTTGSGAATAKGIVTCASAGVTAASGTAIAADELFRLVHSVDPAYRMGAGFMMHDAILLALRLLKDGNGQYLWRSGLDSNAPDSLLSYPITVNQDMQSSIATDTTTILFGQLNKYKIRRVNGIRMYRLEERYRDTDQDGFIAFTREDGNLLTAGTAPVKKLTQA
jgi:HK97 family phage major capsid protein